MKEELLFFYLLGGLAFWGTRGNVRIIWGKGEGKGVAIYRLI